MEAANDRSRSLHLVLERICSLFRTQLREAAGGHRLKLVQLEALIYLSRANRYSDTAGALAEYLGVTRGTASQTVIALERRALVEKKVDANDGRVFHCAVTAAGHMIVKSAHPAGFLTDMADDHQTDAGHAAVELLRALQAGRNFRTFGQCRTCVHFKREGSQHACGLTGERLTRADSLRICREHAGTLP